LIAAAGSYPLGGWKMIKFKINDTKVEALPEWTVLDAAKKNGIHIPTLCYHESVEPSGGCRLCVVEAVEGNWSKVVISCMYPVKEGITILTDSERVKNVQKVNQVKVQTLGAMDADQGNPVGGDVEKLLGPHILGNPVDRDTCRLQLF
jgi:ferredoxin